MLKSTSSENQLNYYQSRPGMDDRKDTEASAGVLSLPPIPLPSMDTGAGSGSNSVTQRIHLPDIRTIDIKLTMSDASVITLRTVPNYNYM